MASAILALVLINSISAQKIKLFGHTYTPDNVLLSMGGKHFNNYEQGEEILGYSAIPNKQAYDSMKVLYPNIINSANFGPSIFSAKVFVSLRNTDSIPKKLGLNLGLRFNIEKSNYRFGATGFGEDRCNCPFFRWYGNGVNDTIESLNMRFQNETKTLGLSLGFNYPVFTLFDRVQLLANANVSWDGSVGNRFDDVSSRSRYTIRDNATVQTIYETKSGGYYERIYNVGFIQYVGLEMNLRLNIRLARRFGVGGALGGYTGYLNRYGKYGYGYLAYSFSGSMQYFFNAKKQTRQIIGL